jgi:hypothetical protein
MYSCRQFLFHLFGLYYTIVHAIPGLNQVECRYSIVGTPNKGNGPPNWDNCHTMLEKLPLVDGIPEIFNLRDCAIIMTVISHQDSETVDNPALIDWSSIIQAAESVLSTCFAPGARNRYLQGETTILLRRKAYDDSSQSRDISRVGSHSPLASRAQRRPKRRPKRKEKRQE